MGQNRTPKKSGPGDVAPKTPASKKAAASVRNGKTPDSGRVNKTPITGRTALPNTPGTGSTDSVTKSRKRKFEEKGWNYTHVLPSAKQVAGNGRQEGRNLITWTRPRMAEKLLMHLIYECSRHSIELPWDAIAHRFHPGSSGGAIIQHLNRLRPILIAEGHLVPPVPARPGVRFQADPAIRGYVRANQDDPSDLSNTRPVRFDEPLEDRRFNLPDAYDGPSITSAAKAGQAIQLGPAVPPVDKPGRRRRPAAKTKSAAIITDDDDESEYYDKGKKPVVAARIRPTRATTSAVKYKEEEDEDVLGGEEKPATDAVAKDDNDTIAEDNEYRIDVDQGHGFDGNNDMKTCDYANESYDSENSEIKEEEADKVDNCSDEELEPGYRSTQLPYLGTFPHHSLSSPLSGRPGDIFSTPSYPNHYNSFGSYGPYSARYPATGVYRPGPIFSSPTANPDASRLAASRDDVFDFDREEADADRMI